MHRVPTSCLKQVVLEINITPGAFPGFRSLRVWALIKKDTLENPKASLRHR